jgi:hypothetical protein
MLADLQQMDTPSPHKALELVAGGSIDRIGSVPGALPARIKGD